MNSDQWQSIIRAIIMMAGNALVAKGLVSSADAPVLETTIVTAIGALATAAPIIWGIVAKSEKAKIASVNAIDGVKVVAQSAPAAQVDKPPETPTQFNANPANRAGGK